VVSSTSDAHRSDGKLTLLVVALLALVFVGVPVAIRYGGTTHGSLPYIPDNPVASIGGGQKIAFAAGDLAVGDALMCSTRGVLVGAKVPKPGHTTTARFVGSEWTSTIDIRVRPDGVVIARCP
jgi:hypothetical protein